MFMCSLYCWKITETVVPCIMLILHKVLYDGC